MASSHWVSGAMSVSTNGVAIATGAGNVRELGTAVFTTYLFAFEATAALLVIAVVGAVLLARRERAHRRGRRRERTRHRRRERPRRLVPRPGAAMLFGIGAFGVLTRRSALIMFMCIELMLNAVNLTFVTFARTLERHRRSGDGLLRDGRRRGRGHGGTRHRGRGLPASRRSTSVDELSEMKG